LELNKKLTAAEKEQFLTELAKKYPEGVTKETIPVSKSFTITRYILIKNKQAFEYKKVETRGGVFYKKNGLDLTESTFRQETKGFDK
jgi:hypothetical protein